MKIGILQTGLCPPDLVEEHGEYDKMCSRFLDGNGFEFVSYRVVENQFPASVDEADGWLLTGSKHGAYEAHSWIPRLENFLRQAQKHSHRRHLFWSSNSGPGPRRRGRKILWRLGSWKTNL